MAISPSSLREKRRNLKKDIIKNVNDGLLSFEEICPQWSFALRNGYTNNSKLDIQDAKNCIVGEAHGFRNRGLRCSKCWEFSQSFTFCTYGNKMHKYIITDNQRFEDLKFDFVSHFNQKHLLSSFSQHWLVEPLSREDSRILPRLRKLILSLFLNQDVRRISNMVIISREPHG